jgi:hypothetical protein
MLLSKSKFLQGHQCKKLLWYACNASDQLPETDAAQQAIFDQGKQVGALAKSLYPGGIEIGAGVSDFEQVLQNSQEAAKARKPLFEAGFVYNGGLARADILNPAGKDAWDIIEVKSSTEVKDVNLLDLAFQTFVYNGAGLNIRRCCVMHVNSEYVRHGAIDPKQFFKLVDVTKEVSGLSREIEPLMEDMFGVIRRKQSPDIQIGQHCSDPYSCPLHDKCWAFLPEQNVTTLYRAGKKAFKLLADGIVALKDIPDTCRLTANQKIQRRAALTGQPHVDLKALAAFLSQLQYPVSYLDFETLGTAIPLFDDAQPYEQIPFQFSLHVVRSAGNRPEHHGFLAEGRNDPRPEFMRRLQAVLPETGSVVAYNAGFEQGRLEECCDLLPDYKPWCQQVKRRMVDLLLPFRGFRYHHPAQHGSASMKAVLPALTGHGYEHLEIQEGVTASLEYLRVTHGDVPEAERQRVREQLERYCGQDTEGMIWIVDALRQIGGGHL